MSERILVVSPRYWPENVKINDICEGIADRGYGVDCLCGQPQTPAGRFFDGYHSMGHKSERHKGVRILRHFETKRGSGTGFRIMLQYLTSSFFANRALHRIKKRSYEAVLIFQTSPVMTCTAGLRVAKKQNIPAVTYAIDIWPESLERELDMQNLLLRRIFKSISDRKYRASDEIVTLTKPAEQYFTEELSIHSGRVRSIVPGPDSCIQRGSASDELLERFSGGFNILTFDPALDRQDYDTLLKGAEMIRDTGMIGIRIIIVCSVDPEELERMIADRDLNDIVFVENVKDAISGAGHYRIASAFLSCERESAGDEYSFPHDLINYMSCARPVIFAGDGVGRRIIREAGCGETVDQEDAEALFNAVIALYRTPKEDLSAMGDAAAAYQKKNFSRSSCIDRLLEVLFRKRDESDDDFIISSGNIIRSDDLFEE